MGERVPAAARDQCRFFRKCGGLNAGILMSAALLPMILRG
jgi:hypothetical protein